MKLHECNPHDLLVVIENEVEIFVELTALNGPGAKKRGTAWLPEYAMVHTYDPERSDTVYGTWRTMSPMVEVVAVHETAAHRRLMRNYRKPVGVEADQETDPLLSGGRNGGF